MLKRKQYVKLNLLDFLLILIALYIIAPIVSRFISSYLTTYFYMLVVVLFIVVLFFSKRMKTVNDCIILLFPFLCWKLLNFFIAKGNILIWSYGALLDLIPLLAGYYMMTFCADDKNNFFMRLILTALAITTLTTVIGCMRHPGASRYLATVKDAGEAEAVLYGWLNLGGYEFVYSVVLLHPLAILAYKKGKINKWLAILCSIATIALAVYSEYTTALLMSLLSSFLYFFKKNLTVKQLLGLVVLALFMFTIFSSLFSKLLIWLAEIIDSDTMAMRLKALATGKMGADEGDNNRFELYKRSFLTFIKNPIFGSFINGGYGVGGHSFILDMLGQFGLCGLAILIFMYRAIYIKFFKKYQNTEGYGYVLWVFILTILLSLLNTGMWLSVLALFAPIILRRIYAEG